MRWPVCAVLLFSAVPALADTVAVAPSATVIPQGGTASFTVSVTPGTYVQTVTVTYGGESGQDQFSYAPCVAWRQFNTPARNKVVTATVSYTNGSPDDVATVTIDVVGVSLTGPASPLRGWPCTYTLKALPTGTPITRCDWTYGVNSYTDLNGDGNDTSTWAGPMVVSDTIQCSVVVLGITLPVSKQVIVANRNWSTPVTCAQDNEPEWGDAPTPGADLGLNRDRDSNTQSYVFVPRNGSDFTPAVTRTCVSTGPCTGWWYVVATTLKCQRETVINRYIKPDAPTLGGSTFAGVNGNCFGPADFLQAVKNHEYRGSPDTPRSLRGHQGRIENAVQLDFYADPRRHIEPLCARTQPDLLADVNDTVLGDEWYVIGFAGDEVSLAGEGANWGYEPTSLGQGGNSRWLGSDWSYDCAYGPETF